MLTSCATSAGSTEPLQQLIGGGSNENEHDSHFRQNLAVFDKKQPLTLVLIETRLPSLTNGQSFQEG
jgi:hypothetical protein